MIHDPLFLVAANLFAAVTSRCLKPNALTALLLGFVIIGSTGYLGTHHNVEIMKALNHGRDLAMTWSLDPHEWPPVQGKTYPSFELLDQDATPTRLEDFKGKVVLVELVGMSCPACVAFSGGQKSGPFRGVMPQPNLESIEVYAKRFGGVRLTDPRIVFVQLVMFDQQMQAPKQEDVQAWAKHFGFRRDRNAVVLCGADWMATEAGQKIVPGFQLLDKNLTLRYDSTGYQPTDDLYNELLPQIRALIKE